MLVELLIVLAAVSTSASAATLAVPGRTNATPTIAADGAFAVVAWSAALPEGTTDIFAAVSRDGAHTFGAPVRVNHIAGDARVNGEQPPRIVLVSRGGADPGIQIVWTTKGTSGTKIVSARSDDGGRSFAPAVTVPESDAAGNRGWENATADRSGRAYAIWLDHREMTSQSMAASHHEHGGGEGVAKPDGVAMAQRSKLYIGTLDGTVAPHPVTGGVCYCCKTAIAVGADGAIYAAWRHVYPGNLRDIAFTVSRDGGRTFAAPIRVSEDRWTLEGCPDDGPAIAVDAANRVHVVWPTLVTDEKTGDPAIAIFYATSQDGRTFTARARVPARGIAHHPQIAMDSGGAPVLAWDETANGSRHAVAASVTRGRDGTPSFTRIDIGGSESGVYPSIARGSGGIIAAWTASRPGASTIRVEPLAQTSTRR